MTPAERVAIREAIAKLEEALAEDEQAPKTFTRCGMPCGTRYGWHRPCTLPQGHLGVCDQ